MRLSLDTFKDNYLISKLNYLTFSLITMHKMDYWVFNCNGAFERWSHIIITEYGFAFSSRSWLRTHVCNVFSSISTKNTYGLYVETKIHMKIPHDMFSMPKKIDFCAWVKQWHLRFLGLGLEVQRALINTVPHALA